MCLDELELLCPRCLPKHNLCYFEAMGPKLTHKARNRFRKLLQNLLYNFNISNATLRKINSSIEALNEYKKQQTDEINFAFNEIIISMNARREYLLKQLDELVKSLQAEL